MFGKPLGTSGFGAPAGGVGAAAPVVPPATAAPLVGAPAAVPPTATQDGLPPSAALTSPYVAVPSADVEQAQQLARTSQLASYLLHLDNAYNALHPSCQFRCFLYNICGPGWRDMAVHRERYTAAQHGGGCSESQWMRALQANPDPINMYPTPVHFAKELQQRVALQKKAISEMTQRVEDLLRDTEAILILDGVNQTVAKELKQNERMIRRRWCALLVKMESMVRQGSKGAEGLIQERATALRQQLDAPGGFEQVLDEVQPYLDRQTSVAARQLQSLKSRAAGGGDDAMERPLLRTDADPVQVKKWVHCLSQMQDGIEALANFLEYNLSTMSAIRKRITVSN